MPALSCQKMKSRINFSSLSTEEIDELKDEGIGNTKCTQQACNTSKNFFTALMHSQDPEILKHNVIAKDASGDVACFFWNFVCHVLRVILSVNFKVFSIVVRVATVEIRKLIQNVCHADLVYFLSGSYFLA